MTEPDRELTEILGAVDALLVRVDAWQAPSTNGGTEAGLVMGEIDAERGLINAREALIKLIAATGAEVERLAIPVRMCQCTDEDNSLCAIHTVGHPYVEGCCDQPEDAHRHMTSAEFSASYPKIFDETVQVEDARYRVDAHRSTRTGEAWVTLTRLFEKKASDDDDDYGGLCFDLPLDALRATLPLLEQVTKI